MALSSETNHRRKQRLPGPERATMQEVESMLCGLRRGERRWRVPGQLLANHTHGVRIIHFGSIQSNFWARLILAHVFNRRLFRHERCSARNTGLSVRTPVGSAPSGHFRCPALVSLAIHRHLDHATLRFATNSSRAISPEDKLACSAMARKICFAD